MVIEPYKRATTTTDANADGDDVNDASNVDVTKYVTTGEIDFNNKCRNNNRKKSVSHDNAIEQTTDSANYSFAVSSKSQKNHFRLQFNFITEKCRLCSIKRDVIIIIIIGVVTLDCIR